VPSPYAAYKRGVLVEPTAWHWAEPEQAPPSLVLGYGTASAPAIRRGIALLRATLLETSRASRQSGSRRSSG
jgi:DNA-binding transcriptional MocR family regulator